MNTMIKTLVSVSLTLCFLSMASAGDPLFYKKKNTWQETMRLSREALAKREAAVRKAEKTMLGP